MLQSNSSQSGTAAAPSAAVQSNSGTQTASKAVVRGGPLDGLRFVAAMFVVIFHFGFTAPVDLRSFHPLWDRGYLATDFFLLLSGFVLARAYGKNLLAGKISPLKFWLKRFSRGYPTHIITLGLLIVLVLGAYAIGSPPDNPERFDLRDLPVQVFLLQVFGTGGDQWNIPSWTLSVLLVCYAGLPWTWRVISKVPTALSAIALALIIMAVSQALSLQLLDNSVFNLPARWVFFRCVPMYLAGLLVARAVELAKWDRKTARLFAIGGCLVLLVDMLAVNSDLLAACAICILTLGFGAMPTITPIKGAVWGAQISFCLFMTHTLTGIVYFDAIVPIVHRLAPVFDPAQGGSMALAWILWLGALATAILVADLFDRMIDTPIQRAIRKRWF